MNCEQVCHLIDDYLENRLGRYERQQLENHVAFCPDCAEELRGRPDFERDMLRALSASVQHMRLSPQVSNRIVHAAQGSVTRAIWSNRAMWVAQAFASVAAVALVVVGVLMLAGEIQVPRGLIRDAQPVAGQPAALLTLADMYVEPQDLSPGEPFAITVFLRSDLPQDVSKVHLNMDFDGPSGDYHFALTVVGPMPSHAISVLQVTPELLADPCWNQYQTTPLDIFGVPGIYTIRASLAGPAVVVEQ